MKKDPTKSVCIRLSQVQFECLREHADKTGSLPTSVATQLVIESLEALQSLSNQQDTEGLIRKLERRLYRTMFAMFTTVANHDEKATRDFREQVNAILKNRKD
jgi:hypothetical protein